MANALHTQLARRILLHARSTGLAAGAHLKEADFQTLLGTSRSPVRGAMSYLAERGVLTNVKNKGFFIADLSIAVAGGDVGAGGEENDLYFRIADDRLTRQLDRSVSENELIRRYGASRSSVRRTLMRIASEGWILRREGRGWEFLALIDSIEAYRESYELRQMLEPAGLISDGYHADPDLLRRLRRQQELVRDGGWQTLGQHELFETNTAFHEGLARLSGNRFLVQTVEQQSQLRRLVEYRQTLNREQVRGQNHEHLIILDLLDDNRRNDASTVLAAHLGSAKNLKARVGIFAAS